MDKKIIIGLIIVFIIALFTFFPYNRLTGHATLEESPIEESDSLVILNWEDYLDPEVIKEFETQTGIDVEEVTFSTMEEERALFKAHPETYDIMIIDDWNFRVLNKLNEFEELDKTNIPNFKNIADEYQNLDFDKGNKYTVPFLPGTTGFMVNSRYINPLPDSWDIFWDKKYQGRTAFLDEKREVISAVLKKLGYSLNTEDPSQLAEVKEELLKQNAQMLDTITVRSKLISEEIIIGQIYGSDALYAAEINPNLVYITPKEGISLWMDNMVISKQSKKKEQAYKFINFILEPEIGAMVANYAWCMTPNKESIQYIDEELASDPYIYLPEDILQKSEYFKEVSEETKSVYDNIYQSYQIANSGGKSEALRPITGVV